MQSIIKKIVWVCLGIIPFTALYVASGQGLDIFSLGQSGMYFPFISGKNFMFRILVEIALAGWILLALRDASYRINIKKSPLIIAYGLFITVLFFANIFGVDVQKSMWSNFERMEGFVGHAHLFIYFIVLSGMLASVRDWTRMFKIFVASNILITLYAAGQLFGSPAYAFSKFFPTAGAWFAANFPISVGATRLDATLGNSAYYAIYAMMFVFICALLWVQSGNLKRSWGYPLLALVNIIGLFYSGTRGTMIGVLVGGFVTLGIIAIKEKGKVRTYVAGTLIALVIAVASIFAFKNTAFIQNSPTLSRLASISPNDITGASRISMWQISYDAWLERPVLGYGQENFSYIFARKFIPEKMSNLEPWYDRSHNVFFDWLTAAGALGLLTYLSLYVLAFWMMWRKKNDLTLREKAILSGLIVGYFIHNIFVFDNLISYVLFALILAYIGIRTSITHSHSVTRGTLVSDENLKLLYAPVVVILLVVTQYYVNYQPLLVNKLILQAMDANRLAEKMPIPEVIKTQNSLFNQALELNTLGSLEAREQYLQTVLRMSQLSIPPTVSAEEKKALTDALNAMIESARTNITATYDTYKDDVRMLSIYGLFYSGIGDPVSAEKVLLDANKLAPKKQLITFDLIRSYLLQQKLAEAYALGKETFEIAPNYAPATKWYLLTALYVGEYKAASENVAAKTGSIPFDEDVLNAAVGLGQTQVAVAMLNDLKKSRPELAAQVDAFIKQIVANPRPVVAVPKK